MKCFLRPGGDPADPKNLCVYPAFCQDDPLRSKIRLATGCYAGAGCDELAVEHLERCGTGGIKVCAADGGALL